MKEPRHIAYIAASLAAAMIAGAGIATHQQVIYGFLPGIIGCSMAIWSGLRFFGKKQDLPGFAACTCGFVFYQAYQANPATIGEFSAYLIDIPIQDQVVGIVFANLTTAMLLIAHQLVGVAIGPVIDRMIPARAQASRDACDQGMFAGFVLVFIIVALPNVLFGKVIVGPFQSIMNQRAAWSDPTLSGYQVFGGEVGGSFNNVTLWAVSLFLLWLYLLKSRYRQLMWVLSPLVLIWTGAVALTGSRTYLVALAVGFTAYALGDPKIGRRALLHIAWTVPLVVLLLQVSAIFRTAGLKQFETSEFAQHALEVRGNEGASCEMDGVEYFRTELAGRGIDANPFLGFMRGLFVRPIEGAMYFVPRSLFPWKLDDPTATEYNLYFQNERLGVPSDTAFIGASPGMIGRELIRYGYFGPLTLLFWMGAILNLSGRLYDADSDSAFNRIVAAAVIAFMIAESRDFVSVWFIPFTPFAAVVIAVRLLMRQPPRPAGPPRTAAVPLPAARKAP